MSPNQKLLAWFRKNQRDLPFRKHKAAYEIWISEIMLQQTRVAAMLPLYSKFLERFPNVQTLALASEEEVLSAWQGLGYYSRARNIRKAAIYLNSNFNGKFPKELEQVLKIPGIGPYTARAILSIAYDQCHAVLDGNVKRVLSRFNLYDENILGTKAEKDLQKLADQFLNTNSPGDHNQAVMELGATLCLPENPKCLTCPLLGDCLAQQFSKTDMIPRRNKQKVQLELKADILWIEQNNNVLLIREKNPRFLKGMFVLPIVFHGEMPSQNYTSSKSLEDLKNEFPYQTILKKFKHTITHHKFEFQVQKSVFTDIEKKNKMLGFISQIEWKWVKISDLSSEFPSSIAKKVMKIIN